MLIDSKTIDEVYITCVLSKDFENCYLNLDLHGSLLLLDLLSNMQEKLILDMTNYLTVEIDDEFYEVEKIVFGVKVFDEDFESIVVNYVSDDKFLYVFLNHDGLTGLQQRIKNILIHQNKGEPNSTIYLLKDWGGDYLTNISFIENSHVVYMFKIYGVI